MDTMTITASATAAPATQRPFFGENGFGFDDILDAINPLQHIPVVNTIYRRLTGDEISMGSRLAGGAVFGGAVGFAASLANAVIEDVSGRDIGGHLVAMVWAERGESPAPAALAQTMQRPAAPDDAGPTVQPAVETAAQAPEPQATPAFLAALAPREQALASREALIEARMPARAASGDVPTLSPAAMEALLASVNITGRHDGEGETREDEGPASDLARPPADFAAWQAATQAWAAGRDTDISVSE